MPGQSNNQNANNAPHGPPAWSNAPAWVQARFADRMSAWQCNVCLKVYGPGFSACPIDFPPFPKPKGV